MHITILLTLSIPPGEAELPVCIRYDAQLHPEPPGPVKLNGVSNFIYLSKVMSVRMMMRIENNNIFMICFTTNHINDFCLC